MHERESLLNDLGELGRLTQVLVLLHVAENEAEWIVFRHSGAGLEAHGLVLHLLDAPSILRLGLGEKIGLKATCGGWVLPSEIRRVHVNRDEQVAGGLVRDPTAV